MGICIVKKLATEIDNDNLQVAGQTVIDVLASTNASQQTYIKTSSALIGELKTTGELKFCNASGGEESDTSSGNYFYLNKKAGSIVVPNKYQIQEFGDAYNDVRFVVSVKDLCYTNAVVNLRYAYLSGDPRYLSKANIVPLTALNDLYMEGEMKKAYLDKHKETLILYFHNSNNCTFNINVLDGMPNLTKVQVGSGIKATFGGLHDLLHCPKLNNYCVGRTCMDSVTKWNSPALRDTNYPIITLSADITFASSDDVDNFLINMANSSLEGVASRKEMNFNTRRTSKSNAAAAVLRDAKGYTLNGVDNGGDI